MKATHPKTVRFTEKEWAKVQWLAKNYAGGNTSLWIVHQALFADRTFVTRASLKRSKK